jgi:hypothetical protein
MGINLDGSMDGRLERASESRREDLRLPGWWAMVSSAFCVREPSGNWHEEGMRVTHVEQGDEEDVSEKCERGRGKRWRVEMKDERSGMRIINGSWDRKSLRDYHLIGPAATVAQLVQYVRYVILERGKKKCIYHGAYCIEGWGVYRKTW